ncbi:MAG: hypothetical protein LC808_05895 [Actinobacteria bacterium]|nr:hypothetical protein [Actinomycetota bacterium]
METTGEGAFLSAAQVSERWGGPDVFPVARVRLWAARGDFPGAFKSRGRWVIPEASLVEYEASSVHARPLTDLQAKAWQKAAEAPPLPLAAQMAIPGLLRVELPRRTR